MMAHRWFMLALLSSGFLSVLGCSENNLASVSGTVTFDGKPIEKGSITFQSRGGKGATEGGEIVNGKYSVRAPLGINEIRITGTKVTGTKKIYDTKDSPTMNTVVELLPKKYNQKTELTLDVKAGGQTKDFDLQK